MTPTSRLTAAWFILALLALPAPWFPWYGVLWSGVACLLAGAAMVDAALVLRPATTISLARTIATSLPVSAPSPVTLTLTNTGERLLSLSVHDLYPDTFTATDLPAELVLPPGKWGQLRYTVTPGRRGRHAFTGAEVGLVSPFGLWRRKRFLPCSDTVRVFPDFRSISRFTLLAVSHDLGQMGIRKIPRRGAGGEFHQLREYRDGDELRNIDWKATSRYRRLISREYQDERDQQLVFMLDCGRRMRHLEAGTSLLDQALAAVLLLAHVAARQGDAAGVYSFGGTERWIPPLKCGDSVHRLLEQTFDLHATTSAADYLSAAARVSALQRRRSLVIMVTSSRGEDQDDVLQAALLLARTHLVLVADLRESILERVRSTPVTSFDDALRYQALLAYLDQRTALRRLFTHHGIQSLDVTAARLPAALVNRYLEIKATGRL